MDISEIIDQALELVIPSKVEVEKAKKAERELRKGLTTF